jgi:hypothetical protein
MAAQVSRTQAVDIAAIEAEGFGAYLPHASPLAMLRASAQTFPDHEAIRFLRDVDDPR